MLRNLSPPFNTPSGYISRKLPSISDLTGPYVKRNKVEASLDWETFPIVFSQDLYQHRLFNCIERFIRSDFGHMSDKKSIIPENFENFCRADRNVDFGISIFFSNLTNFEVQTNEPKQYSNVDGSHNISALAYCYEL